MKDRIKALRTALNLSQADFADKLDVSRGLVNKWEQGFEIHEPRRVQICEIFGVRPEWLERGEGTMFPTSSQIRANALRDWLKATFENFPEWRQRSILIAMNNNPQLFFNRDVAPKELTEYIDTLVSSAT